MPWLIFPPSGGPVSVNVTGVHSDAINGGEGATVFVFGSGPFTTGFVVEHGGAISLSFGGVEVDAAPAGLTAGPVVSISAVEAIGYVVDRGFTGLNLGSVGTNADVAAQSVGILVDAAGVATTTDAGAVGSAGASLGLGAVQCDTAVSRQSTTLGGTITVAAPGVEADAYAAQLQASTNDQTAATASADVGGVSLSFAYSFGAVHSDAIAGTINGVPGLNVEAVFATGYVVDQVIPGAIYLNVSGVAIDAIQGSFSLATSLDLAGVGSDSDVGTTTAGASPVVQGVGASGVSGAFSLGSAVNVAGIGVDAVQGGDLAEILIRTPAIQIPAHLGSESLTIGGATISNQPGVEADAVAGGLAIDYPGSVDVDGVEADAFPGTGAPPSVTSYPDPFIATDAVVQVDPFAATSYVSVNPFAATARLK